MIYEEGRELLYAAVIRALALEYPWLRDREWLLDRVHELLGDDAEAVLGGWRYERRRIAGALRYLAGRDVVNLDSDYCALTCGAVVVFDYFGDRRS